MNSPPPHRLVFETDGAEVGPTRHFSDKHPTHSRQAPMIADTDEQIDTYTQSINHHDTHIRNRHRGKDQQRIKSRRHLIIKLADRKEVIEDRKHNKTSTDT